MEIMIEFIVTLLIELFFDGSIDIFTSKRVPIPVRILVLTIFVIVMGGFFGFFFWIAVHANVVLGGMLLLFELFLAGCIIYAVRKKILHRRGHGDGDVENKGDF